MNHIVICFPNDEKIQDKLMEQLHQLTSLKTANKVTFVNVFKQEMFPYMVPPTIFPTEEQKGEITKSLTQIIENKTAPLELKNRAVDIFFHDSDKEGVCEYLKSSSCDLVITLTKKRHPMIDLFTSTFSEYLVRHTAKPVLILKEN